MLKQLFASQIKMNASGVKMNSIKATSNMIINNFTTVNRKPSNLKYPFDPMNTTVKKPHLTAEQVQGMSIDEIAASIDTTITDEQRIQVNKLKKTGRGTSTVRSLYRDVPNPEELATTGNFISKIADNAEELIDYAYTFIPPREGARNSRRKKRMEHRRKQTVHDHERRIRETEAALKKKHERKVKQVKLMKKYQQEAIKISLKGLAEGESPYVPINYEKYQKKKEKFRLMRDKMKMSKLNASE